jgi:hypothetical protein
MFATHHTLLCFPTFSITFISSLPPVHKKQRLVSSELLYTSGPAVKVGFGAGRVGRSMLYKNGNPEGSCVKENFDVGQFHHGCPGAQISTTRLFVHTNHGSLAEYAG